MLDQIETPAAAESLLADLERELSAPSGPVSIQEFWRQSVSSSVISDYESGRVIDV